MKVNQVKIGAALSYVSILTNNVVALLYTPFMLRMMGQNEYGLFSLVSSVIAYLTLLDLGFNDAIVRYTAKYRAENKVEEQHEMFGMFFLLYVVIGIVVLLLGTILYFNVNNLFGETMTQDDLYKIRVMMILLIFNVAFTFPMSIFGGIITAYERFVFLKIVNIARIILNPVVMIILLNMGYRAIGMAVVTTVFNIFVLTVNAFYCIGHLHIKIRIGSFNWRFLKEVSFYSFWIFLAAIVDRLYWGSGQFILGINRSAAEIAVFAVAIQIQSFYTSFSYAISSVLLPRIVALVTKGASNTEISDFFVKIARIQFYPMSLILYGFILFGRQFISYWAGPDYDGAYWIALCFMVPQLFTTMQQTGYGVLQAQRKVKFRSVCIFIACLLSIAMAVPLSKEMGGLGIALCVAAGLIIGNLLLLDIYYEREIKLNMRRFWKETIKLSMWPIVFTIVYAVILNYFSFNGVWGYLLHILLFASLFLMGCVVFNFNDYERELFLQPGVRMIKR